MRLAAAVWVGVVTGGVAWAADTPVVQPTRDVDVTYRVPVPGGGDASLLQRLRWSAATRRQRVDLPAAGNWMVLDFGNHRMELVRDESREVVDLPAPRTAGQPGAGYTREGAAQVAGLACTQWRTIDTRGEVTDACYTADGVLLRAVAGSRVLMEAVSVTYAPQGGELFVPPAGYAHQQTNK